MDDDYNPYEDEPLLYDQWQLGREARFLDRNNDEQILRALI